MMNKAKLATHSILSITIFQLSVMNQLTWQFHISHHFSAMYLHYYRMRAEDIDKRFELKFDIVPASLRSRLGYHG